MSRFSRIGFGLLTSLLLAGCGSDSDFSQLGGVLVQSFSGIGGDGPPVERDKAAAVPFATIGVRYGSSAEAMLVLATKSGDESEWLAGTQVSIITRAGHIVRTVGLPRNLTGVQGPIADTGPDTQPGSYHYLYDFADKRIFGAMVECTQKDAGPERIEIIGGTHDTRHIVEDCRAPFFDWDFQNDYWRDMATGYIWKSIQNTHPDGDPVTVEALRPEQ
jgi:hypothetical protein